MYTDFLHEGSLQHGESVALLTELLDEFRGRVADVAEKQRGLAVEKVVKT